MSAPFSDLFITNGGNAITASAWASSGVITITSVQFGSGFPGVSDNIPGYTALKSPVCNGQITGENVLVAGQCTIRVNLAGTAIPSTFQINEIGVFASFAGGGSQLVAYMSTGAATGDTLTFNSPVVKDYAILVTFSQGVITTVNISLFQTVGLHAVNHLDNGIDPIPPPSTARSGLLLKNPNDVTQVLVGSNPPSWAPALIVIRGNVTLFVSTTGNDSSALAYLTLNFPAINNNSASPFLTIQGALQFLKSYFIQPGFIVTISVAAGVYTSSTPISVNHPNGSQISIVGVIGSQINSTAASASSATVTLTGPFLSNGISTGDYIIAICATGGQTAQLASGVFRVTGINASVLTYNAGVGIPVAFSGTPTFSVRKLYSVLQFSAGVTGINISGGGLGLVENFALVGTSSGSSLILGISVSGSCSATIQTCGGTGWTDSSVASSFVAIIAGAIVSVTDCHANSNSNGFVSSYLASQLNGTNCIANVNTYGGFRNNQSNMTLVNCWGHGNQTGGGFTAVSKAVTSLNSSSSYYSANGVVVSVASLIYTQGINILLNNTTDVNLAVASVFAREGGTVLSYATRSGNISSINTLTADGCYFSP